MSGGKNLDDPVVIPEERYDLQILYSLRRIVRSIDIHSRKLDMRYDITAPQLVSLLAICDLGPLTIAALSKEIYLSPSTLVGIIDRLEAKGLIERERNKQDRRKVLITATEKGRDFAANAPSPLQETLARALSELTSDEQRTIALSLQRVFELMETKELADTQAAETEALLAGTEQGF